MSTWSNKRACLSHGTPGSIAFFLIVVIPALFVLVSTGADAASTRCPKDILNAKDANPVESARITQLWKALHGPGAAGGDGPLGCPIGKIVAYDRTDYSWKGVGQIFQRGWISVGRDAFAGSEIAIVHGWDSWTVWWKGLPANVESAINFKVGAKPGHTAI